MISSPSLRPLTEDEFDLIAAESMFGQHLELQHLSEVDSGAAGDGDTTDAREGTSLDAGPPSKGTMLGHSGGTLGLGPNMTNYAAASFVCD